MLVKTSLKMVFQLLNQFQVNQFSWYLKASHTTLQVSDKAQVTTSSKRNLAVEPSSVESTVTINSKQYLKLESISKPYMNTNVRKTFKNATNATSDAHKSVSLNSNSIND